MSNVHSVGKFTRTASAKATTANTASLIATLVLTYRIPHQFKYPFSQALRTTAYEIDKANSRYIALDAAPPQPGPDILHEDFANLAPDQRPAVALQKVGRCC